MFTFKNQTSEQMGLEIGNGISYPSTSGSLEFIEIDGRDGALVIDKKRYKRVNWPIPVILKTDQDGIEPRITDITNWLLTDLGEHDWLWDSDPDFIYRAFCYDQYGMDRLLSNFGKAVINFNLHPIKYLSSTYRTESAVPNNRVISNPYRIDARPRLRIVGSGDIEIQIGGRPLRLRGIDGGCIIDSESQTITSLDGQRTMFSHMFDLFPTLRPGDNRITINRNDVQMHIIPRLGALI